MSELQDQQYPYKQQKKFWTQNEDEILLQVVKQTGMLNLKQIF